MRSKLPIIGLSILMALAVGSCSLSHADSTLVAVPNLLGMTQEEATTILDGAGLRSLVEQSETASFPAGRVCDQNPRAGTIVEKDSFVSLYVARQPSGEGNQTATSLQTPAGSATAGESTTETKLTEYLLSTSVEGQGTIQIVPDQPSYSPGTVATLTAIPAGGWTFDRWGGDVATAANPFLHVMVPDDVNIIAHFSFGPIRTAEVVGGETKDDHVVKNLGPYRLEAAATYRITCTIFPDLTDDGSPDVASATVLVTRASGGGYTFSVSTTDSLGEKSNGLGFTSGSTEDWQVRVELRDCYDYSIELVKE